MGQPRSRIASDQVGDISSRPTVPAPGPSGRYRLTPNEERETIPASAERALTDDERIATAQFEAIKLLRRALRGR